MRIIITLEIHEGHPWYEVISERLSDHGGNLCHLSAMAHYLRGYVVYGKNCFAFGCCGNVATNGKGQSGGVIGGRVHIHVNGFVGYINFDG